ncbi:IS3 family transposase [Halovibrio salipaludis]|uniref:IS3 family transposase n=1 Tax=Halovibrio salipaludis TaxID=2032626 RepID=A0A2A2EUG6_9GAMM|nr:IS3 family transposase [Halovibrio salipaludis]PAU77061.1 IS3 family transposase [Halovibrio salipaludis]
MSGQRYSEEFKIEAVKQVTERGHKVSDVCRRLGVTSGSLYKWIKHYGDTDSQHQQISDQQAELRRMKAELRRVTEERDILKKGRSVLCQGVRVKYRFIRAHQQQFPVRAMCRVLNVHFSGFYAWLHNPESPRTKANQRLLGLIKQSWLESGCVYGYRNITLDLKDLGEQCSKNRVYRLMRREGIRAQRGYKRHRGYYGGKPAHVAPNHLNRDFQASSPNERWVSDITYIRTHEGYLYLATVVDLFSRQVVGWSMKQRMSTDLIMDALLMASWRRRPKQTVLIHSDQGAQYTSREWQHFLKEHNLAPSMSRRGNCHDNAVAESFFSLLKSERIKRRIYKDRETARRDIFDYIEMFYNPIRRHGTNGGLSPMEFEKQYFEGYPD